MSDNLNAFEFFKEELDADDQSRRLEAMKRVKYIAWHVGPKTVVKDLVPHIFECAKTEPNCNDDEFLYRFAEQLAVFMDFCDEKYITFIPVLEYLASQEETVVRTKAIEVLSKIAEKAPSLVSDHIVPVLQRLTGADWFTPRVSACSLFPAVYPHATDTQKTDMRKWYGVLCSDDTPMVRRAAAEKLKNLVSVIDKQSIMNDIIPVYRQLAQEDTQDGIRVSCVYTSLVLIERVFNDNPDENKAHTLLVITNAAEDRSWRVRLAVAKHFHLICRHMGPDITATFLLAPFVQLMKDSEQEVRKSALEAVECCIPFLTTEQLTSLIVPQFQSLALDGSHLVRSVLADIIGPVCKALGKDLTQKHLLTIISDLMKDEYHEVRQNVVSHAAQICSVLGADVLSHSLLNNIQSLFMDNQWRIRECVIQQVPSLAKQFGPEMFHSKLELLFLASFNDSVFRVRDAAIKTLREISTDFGSVWSVEHLLPKILEQYSTTAGYSSRLTCLSALPQICPVIQPEQIVQSVIPICIKSTKDSVPNVRFMACMTIGIILTNYNLGSAVVSTQIKPALTDLLHDTDLDVQYHSAITLGLCDE
eukprot:GEMP01009787.1.p1 GENE.GEMP01009787.1~~GEMP01009787.1.p1  ORF type:complete len:589 (+),score=86.95 GEMP01009787.1:254-2020(+)